MDGVRIIHGDPLLLCFSSIMHDGIRWVQFCLGMPLADLKLGRNIFQ